MEDSMNAMKEAVVTRLIANSSEQVRFKSQVRGERELTTEEKRQIVEDVLLKSPANFLSRFGLTLDISSLAYFRQFSSDPEVAYHIRNLEERLNAERLRIMTKNRRYAAIPRLEKTGYFDELEMQKRDPLLYEELIEKYLNEGDKKALAKARECRDGASTHPFADLLMESLIERPEVDAMKIRQQERLRCQEEEEEFDEEVDGVAEASDDRTPVRDVVEDEVMAVDGPGRELLRAEFRHTMEERFLDGHDVQHLSYVEIDQDSTLDVSEEYWRDKEDEYFDDEEPSPEKMTDGPDDLFDNY